MEIKDGVKLNLKRCLELLFSFLLATILCFVLESVFYLKKEYYYMDVFFNRFGFINLGISLFALGCITIITIDLCISKCTKDKTLGNNAHQTASRINSLNNETVQLTTDFCNICLKRLPNPSRAANTITYEENLKNANHNSVIEQNDLDGRQLHLQKTRVQEHQGNSNTTFPLYANGESCINAHQFREEELEGLAMQNIYENVRLMPVFPVYENIPETANINQVLKMEYKRHTRQQVHSKTNENSSAICPTYSNLESSLDAQEFTEIERISKQPKINLVGELKNSTEMKILSNIDSTVNAKGPVNSAYGLNSGQKGDCHSTCFEDL